MKKVILTLSIALCFNSAFALDPVLQLKSPSYEITYSGGNRVYNAYYNANGEMVTAFRHILSSDLPMILSFSLKKMSKNMWVTDVVEVLNENKSTSYFVNLENANEKITLKSRNGKKWKIQRN
ncbi:MAG: hypothetical protein ACR2KB_08995 [Chitinophagaceae bacterium]